MAARRRTILVFNDRGPEKGVERLALGGGSSGGLYQVYRDPEVEGRELWGRAQWALLRKLVEERRPATIAVNVSHTHAFSDGLSAGEREQLEAALGPWTSRVVRAEGLALDYVAMRVPEMLPTYRQMMRDRARADRARVLERGHHARAHHHRGRGVVAAPAGQRPGPGRVVPAVGDRAAPGRTAGTSPCHRGRPRRTVIERGDHLHTDFGINAMGLATDTQHVGYVLKPGETDAPAGLRAGARELEPAAGPAARAHAAGPHRQRGARRHAGRDEGGGIDGHRLHASDRRPRPRRGSADRPLGPAGGDARAAATCSLLPSTWFSIELQATTPVPGVGRPAAALRAGGGRGDRRRRQRHLGARTSREVSPGEVITVAFRPAVRESFVLTGRRPRPILAERGWFPLSVL